MKLFNTIHWKIKSWLSDSFMRRFGDFQSNADSNIHELIKEKSHNLLYFTFNHWAQFVGISVYNMQSLYLSAFEKKKLSLRLTTNCTQFSSVTQSCPTLCDPMNCSTPGLPVHYQLPEFTQTHVHWVGDAIQPSHLLSFPSPPAPNPSQHQSLFQWVNSSQEMAKVLEFQL